MADSATSAHAAPTSGHGGHHGGADESRRDFLLLSTLTIGATGAALAAWPLVDTLRPAKDVLALASTEVDVTPIEPGQSITVVWRGKPVFIRHRTPGEIAQAQKEMGEKDPQPDAARVKKPEWLVLVGICTHLGCIPLGQRSGEPKGNYNGWFCPCHGSHYDTSGRVRMGPAPRNLEVPPYAFVGDTTIRIG
jgi:ubiquinol-cytochrome c reductase iron-sulfur subunit